MYHLKKHTILNQNLVKYPDLIYWVLISFTYTGFQSHISYLSILKSFIFYQST